MIVCGTVLPHPRFLLTPKVGFRNKLRFRNLIDVRSRPTSCASAAASALHKIALKCERSRARSGVNCMGLFGGFVGLSFTYDTNAMERVIECQLPYAMCRLIHVYGESICKI